MGTTNFYAADDDFEPLLRYVFAALKCRVFETYSSFDHPLREFASAEEACASIRAERQSPSPRTIQLTLWPIDASGEVQFKRIELSPSTGHCFRFAIEGWGLISLQLGALAAQGLHPSRVSHNFEARANKWAATYPAWGAPAGWRWAVIEQEAKKLGAQLRKQSVVKQGSRFVLPGAQKVLDSGVVALDF